MATVVAAMAALAVAVTAAAEEKGGLAVSPLYSYTVHSPYIPLYTLIYPI